ncbi:GspH/FimT family pseudopilin [Methyloversatilis sp.]|uniref:GspH/FimT family pseudopilin n=1 Tax=Methyloversatilis sp. TaxID=2569862 RepID=UPI00273662C3|nr:GspH/FimT family pseudopilin [Methyloversatilis sp.]MDP2868137.1 GspH/FimT family pseudopilin [Methyloversatilis sp.]MDP3454294.1 GspH/FimT family pseudopilin [Methyloversatilis sp.]MDP3579675.1 GspH/FimT family pseudopilin [Methyloversatilis sp.]
MTRLRTAHAGFTMIELMIVVTLMAILAAFAFPSFQSFIASSRLTAESNELLSGMNLARSEAVRIQRRVLLCRAAAADGVVNFSATTGCVTTADSEPWQAWAVFVDENTNGAIDGTERIVRVQAITGNALELISNDDLAAAGNRIAFRPDGMARGQNSLALQAAEVRVCDRSGALSGSNMRVVSLVSGSRMSVARGTDANCGVTVAPVEEGGGSTPVEGS